MEFERQEKALESSSFINPEHNVMHEILQMNN